MCIKIGSAIVSNHIDKYKSHSSQSQTARNGSSGLSISALCTLQLRHQWFTGHKCRVWWGCITEHSNDAVYHRRVFCSLQLSLQISQHISKAKKRTIKEGAFFPLIKGNNRKTFVQSLPPFHLWVVNFDSFSYRCAAPDKDERFATKAPLCRCSSEAERAHNEGFHWWATLLPRPAQRAIHTSESPSSLRGCVSLLFPLLTQISGGSLKQSALPAQCGIKVAVQIGFPWELIN